MSIANLIEYWVLVSFTSLTKTWQLTFVRGIATTTYLLTLCCAEAPNESPQNR